MSLNVDSVEITQAYQGALAEAGGWYDIQSLRNLGPPANVLRIGSCSSTRQGMLSKC
jgi:hypothetical protein